jgi:hypothetical protein
MSNLQLEHFRPHESMSLRQARIRAEFSSRPKQLPCADGYVISVCRADGTTITDHQVQLLLHRLLDGMSGRPSNIGKVSFDAFGNI